MYNLAVGALFKNEAHALHEWLNHYLARGVEHFFLINDGSTDNFMTILEPYIDKISLFNANFPMYLGRQRDMYNKYILPELQHCKWLLLVDLDEFMWSPRNTNFVELLKLFEHVAQFQVNHTLFGSNGYIKQPESIVASFTKRASNQEKHGVNLKYFIQGKYKFSSLNVHHATFVNPEEEATLFKQFGSDWWQNNHYSCQSRMFWDNIKCTRGDSDNYRVRNPDQFSETDFNDVEDNGLKNQNIKLGIIKDDSTASDS
jgi:hypothetical protein